MGIAGACALSCRFGTISKGEIAVGNIVESCTLCPRHCGSYRGEREGRGFCRMGTWPVVARAALHMWEEPCISGTEGSGTIFFSGCSLGCVFCQNTCISTEHSIGEAISVQRLHELMMELAQQGARNINLVTPTHFLPAVREALEMGKPPVPVVYNCGGYEEVEALRTLEGLVDIYLPDMKYRDRELGQRLSGVPDYPEKAAAAIREMVRQTGPARYFEDGMMKSGTMIRHLILPGHTKNSIAVLQWISDTFHTEIPVSLMAQYVPCGRAREFPEINRRITRREYEKVLDALFRLDLDGYAQDLASAKKDFIPPFSVEEARRIAKKG